MSETIKPRGRAIEWDNDDLDAMTDPQYLMRAAGEAAAWAEDHAPALAELLNAEDMERETEA